MNGQSANLVDIKDHNYKFYTHLCNQICADYFLKQKKKGNLLTKQLAKPSANTVLT